MLLLTHSFVRSRELIGSFARAAIVRPRGNEIVRRECGDKKANITTNHFAAGIYMHCLVGALDFFFIGIYYMVVAVPRELLCFSFFLAKSRGVCCSYWIGL